MISLYLHSYIAYVIIMCTSISLYVILTIKYEIKVKDHWNVISFKKQTF